LRKYNFILFIRAPSYIRWNAGVLAAQIMAASHSKNSMVIADKLGAYKSEMTSAVARMNDNL
jgi:phosphoribosylcarboxyaminoimidazole (NCAIR) mutase